MISKKNEILWSTLEAHNFNMVDKMLDHGMDIDVSILSIMFLLIVKID